MQIHGPTFRMPVLRRGYTMKSGIKDMNAIDKLTFAYLIMLKSETEEELKICIDAARILAVDVHPEDISLAKERARTLCGTK